MMGQAVPLPEDVRELASGVRFHACRDLERWTRSIAVAVAASLRRDLEERPRARLLVSGGSTPAPVFDALSLETLPWERIDIALVDERWLRPDDPDSNAHLVRRHLLRNLAASARFETLTQSGRGLEESVSAANMHGRQSATLALLGMGDDGHTASLFPGMRDLPILLEARSAYVAVDASGCPGAGSWPRRISLTPAGLANARQRMLLIRGAGKRAVFERAIDGRDPCELPVRIAFTTPGASLDVYWCP